MQTHHFTVHIADPPDLWERFDELVDRFWADGKNDDASPSMSQEHMRIDFHREAETLSDAVRSAVAAVRSIGLEVDRIEIDRDELALMLGETTVGELLERSKKQEDAAAVAA